MTDISESSFRLINSKREVLKFSMTFLGYRFPDQWASVRVRTDDPLTELVFESFHNLGEAGPMEESV